MYFADDRNLFPQEELICLYQLVLMAEARFLSSAKADDFQELICLYHLIKMAEARFLSSAKAGDFPFYFQKMPLLACREEVVRKFLETRPSLEYMRKALAHCTHPCVQPVFEAWLQANPSAEEVGRFREYCGDFLAAYPEAAKKVESLY